MSVRTQGLPRLPGRRGPRRGPLTLAVAAFVLASAFVGLGLEAKAYDEEETPTLPASSKWSEEILHTWSITPIQSGGRVMPFYTWARYALMGMNSSASCKLPDGEKLAPVEWALDVMFRPEIAKHYECFMVENDEVLVAAELDLEALRRNHPKKKRDRYSYDQLLPARTKVAQLAAQYAHIEQKLRSPVEGGLVELDSSLDRFEALAAFLDMSRRSFEVPVSLRPTFGGAEKARFSEVVSKARDILWMETGKTERSAQLQFLQDVNDAGGVALAILPPALEQKRAIERAREKRELLSIHPEGWLRPREVITRLARAPTVPAAPAHVAMLADLEEMVSVRDDPQEFLRVAQRFQRQGKELASALGEYGKVELEVAYYNWHFWHTAAGFFGIAFLLVVVSWLWPNRWLSWGGFGITMFAALVAAVGITVRCVIRERPPVLNLYDTVLFITAMAVLSLLVVEILNRKRIALAMAPLLGLLGIVLALNYEGLDKSDTMGEIPAVLDTNFWLAIHVIAISIGYMGSLVTGALGHVYVLGKVTGFRKNDSEFYRNLGRMLYGTLAFGLIFSTVGTILGGIWANESWGRFWGWDPKENGALIICLWSLGMVHARLGGYVKTWGLAMASIFLGVVVAFSWWHVNYLGVGLHSYGFTKGVITTLTWFYSIEAAVLLTGTIWWFLQRQQKAKPA